MFIGFDLINGVALGIEYISCDDEYQHTIIIDLLIVRLLIQWS
jgi:hypothetical protein